MIYPPEQHMHSFEKSVNFNSRELKRDNMIFEKSTCRSHYLSLCMGPSEKRVHTQFYVHEAFKEPKKPKGPKRPLEDPYPVSCEGWVSATSYNPTPVPSPSPFISLFPWGGGGGGVRRADRSVICSLSWNTHLCVVM